MATPQFSGVGEPAQVRGEGLEPGKSYRLHWTRVIGNRMTGAGWEQSSTSVAIAIRRPRCIDNLAYVVARIALARLPADRLK